MKDSHKPEATDSSGEIDSLLRTIREAEQRLLELMGGDAKSVAPNSGQARFLKDAKKRLGKTRAARPRPAGMEAVMLDALPGQIALLDSKGVIVSVNESWRRFAAGNGSQASEFFVGSNYLDVCDRAGGECADGARAASIGIRQVLEADGETFKTEYPCHSPSEKRWFRLMVSPVRTAHFWGAVVMHVDITERKLAEAALRESEERFRGIFSTGGTGMALSTPQGQFLEANATYCQMLGYTEGELRTMNFASITHPDDLTLNVELRDELLAGLRKSFIMEKRYVRKNGAIIWTRNSVSKVLGPDGSITSLVAVAEDITDRRLAEDALRQSEERLRLITNLVPQGIFVKDSAGRHIFANRALAEISGHSVEEIVGKTDYELVSNRAQAEAYRANDRDVIQSGSKMFISEEPRTDLSGRTRFLQTIKTRYTVPETGELGVLGVCTDITEHKRAEEALLRQQTELQVLFDLMPAMLCFKDTKNVFLRVNRRMADAAGMPIWEIEGKGAAEVFPLQAEKYYADDLEVIRSGKAKMGIVETLQAADGTTLFVQTDKVPVYGKDNKVSGIVVMVQDITERKRAEEALLRRQTELQVLFDLIPAMIWFKDTKNGIIRVNQRVADAAGRSVADIEGKPTSEIYPQEAAKYFAQDMEVIRSQKPKFGFVETLRGPKGDPITVETDKVPMFDKDGNVVGVIVMAQDVTERRRAEEALTLFRTLVDKSPDSIEVFDPSTGRFLDVNETTCNSLGYSREEMLAMVVPDIVDTAGRNYSFEESSANMKKSAVAIFEGRRRRKDGSTFPVEINGRYIKLEREYMVSVVRDITDRKRIEGRFRLLVDSNVQGVLFWNRNGAITGANDALLSMVGYSREDLEAGRVNWRTLTPPEYAHLDRRSLEEIDARGFGSQYEKEYIAKDGTRVPVLLGAAAFEDNRDEGVCFVVDLTERKKLEQQFFRAQRMESIGTLAGGIAHDLNNILAPILLSIRLLRDAVRDKPALDILETIDVSAKRGAETVRQVLSFARGLDNERIAIRPIHAIKEIKNIIRDTFPKDIRHRFSIPDDIWTIYADPTQLHQVLLNLCVNARDAMPHGGALTVGFENCVVDEQYASMNRDAKAGNYVKITISDTGSGIPREIIDRIFEPFFTTKEPNKGTGLGLSTVMAIVKSHEGIVNVYSEPGKGTTFRVYLPATEASAAKGEEKAADAELVRGKGETVLLVDDEASILEISSKTLQAFGYSVLTAADGAEAVAVFASSKDLISAVITDMTMPVMDGAALIHALRRMNPGIRIIAASGFNTNRSDIKLARTGINNFLSKPYTAEVLLKVLRATLDAP